MGRAGTMPSPHAVTISDEPISASRRVRSSPADTSVGTDEPGMRSRSRAIFSASPPRAGAKALSATPATYAPATVTVEMCFSG